MEHRGQHGVDDRHHTAQGPTEASWGTRCVPWMRSGDRGPTQEMEPKPLWVTSMVNPSEMTIPDQRGT